MEEIALDPVIRQAA